MLEKGKEAQFVRTKWKANLKKSAVLNLLLKLISFADFFFVLL